MQQANLFTNEFEQIKREIESKIGWDNFIAYLREEQLEPKRLKKGGYKCFGCDREMKAFGYSLNENLIEVAGKIYDYCKHQKTSSFLSKFVSEEHKFLSQFQKLKIFGIIRRNKKSSYWTFTRVGKMFMEGRTTLPEKNWVFNDRVVDQSDEDVNVGQAKRVPDWKKSSQDWTQDYIPHSYDKVKELSL